MINHIDVLVHSSIRIRTESGSIYIDPFHMDEETHDAAFILITHDHYDHFSPEDIRKAAREDTVMVVPENMKKKAGEAADLVAETVTVSPGHSYTVKGLSLETIPAYNVLKPFHPKSAGWVGYILNLDGKRIYIAGDTDITDENKKVSCDIALVPVGGTYTMDAKKAAKLVNLIRPEIAVPMHYGDIVGDPKDAEIFKKNVDPAIKVAIRMA